MSARSRRQHRGEWSLTGVPEEAGVSYRGPGVPHPAGQPSGAAPHQAAPGESPQHRSPSGARAGQRFILGGDAMGTPRRWHLRRHRRAGRRGGSCGGRPSSHSGPLPTGSPAEMDPLVRPPVPAPSWTGKRAEPECAGLTLAGHQVPTKAVLSLPSSAGQGKQNTAKAHGLIPGQGEITSSSLGGLLAPFCSSVGVPPTGDSPPQTSPT